MFVGWDRPVVVSVQSEERYEGQVAGRENEAPTEENPSYLIVVDSGKLLGLIEELVAKSKELSLPDGSPETPV